jgi:hypothetical protein
MTNESITVNMNVEEIDFMIADLTTKLTHQKHVIYILKTKKHDRFAALQVKTACHRMSKMQTDLDFLHLLKQQLEMGTQDDQWLMDFPIYLSTIQKMRLKYASLLAKAANFK